MILENIYEAIFFERKNRFVGEANLNGKKILFHIGDTGRLKELLYTGNKILIQKLDQGSRKYNFRLIGVKGLLGDYILLNSLLHSSLVREYLSNENISYKAEFKVGDSKIDFLIYNDIFVEVKGCSLIKKINNEYIAMFPDAPTIRGKKHLKELLNLIKIGKKAELWFILTNNVNKFYPNFETDKEFGKLFFDFLNTGKVKFFYCKLLYLNGKVKLLLSEKKVNTLK